MGWRKIFVAGVDPVGVAFVFEEIAAAVEKRGKSSCWFEPYMMAQGALDPLAFADGFQLRPDLTDPRAMLHHLDVPLFLDGAHPVHDALIDEAACDDGHMILGSVRANGRLKAWLAAHPDMQVIGVVRDVFGAVNASLDTSPLLGEDFHASDEARLWQEADRLIGGAPDLAGHGPFAHKALAGAFWWKAMTRALLDLKWARPRQVLLIEHDALFLDRKAVFDRLDRFTGLKVNRMRGRMRAGLPRERNYLGNLPAAELVPYHKWLRRRVLGGGLDVASRSGAIGRPLASVLGRAGPAEPLPKALTAPMTWAGDWRRAHAALEREKWALEKAQADVIAQFVPAHAPVRVTDAPGIGVIVPFSDGPAGLERTVRSIWAQRGARARAVLVDDGASAEASAMARRLADEGPAQLVVNRRALGIGLSRHKGVLASREAWISTANPGEVLLPEKLAAELDALGGHPRKVAYSGQLHRSGSDVEILGFEALPGLDRHGFIAALMGNPAAAPRGLTFSRALYDRTRGFDAKLTRHDEWGLLSDLLAAAGAWERTGHFGISVQAEPGQTPDAGSLEEAQFMAQLALLRGIDTLTLELGGDVLDVFEAAIRACGPPPPATIEALRALRAGGTFPGVLLDALRGLGAALTRTAFRDDLSYGARLEAAYRAAGLLPAGGKR